MRYHSLRRSMHPLLLALVLLCPNAWGLPAHYTLTNLGPPNPDPNGPPTNESLGSTATDIADDSNSVVGFTINVDTDLTPWEFRPTLRPLPGMDGQLFGDGAILHFNTGGRTEAVEGTRIVGEVTRPGEGGFQHAILWDGDTVTDLEAASGVFLESSTAEAVNADDVCGSGTTTLENTIKNVSACRASCGVV